MQGRWRAGSSGTFSLTDTRLVNAAPGSIVDSDGNGVSNKLEFLAGLNPNDPAEGIIAVTPLISKSGASWQLLLRTIPNRRYQIEKSADLGTWSNAGTSFTISAANAAYLWTDPARDPAKHFYRARISLP